MQNTYRAAHYIEKDSIVAFKATDLAEEGPLCMMLEWNDDSTHL